MPSDSNGVYSLPSGYLAVTGDTIQASQHNPPLEDLASAMTQRLMRSGAAPMTGPLKMVDGSVGSPAAQFSNNGSTGFYKTTDGIGVAVDGVLVAEFVGAGLVKGSRYIGELIPFSGGTAQPLTVIANGQTLNRTDFPDLWAFAQDEIADGNTFYNNGNGSTTFGVGDTRGRVIAGLDDDAGRLTAATGIGAAFGAQTATILQANLPNLTLTTTIAAGQGSHTHSVTQNANRFINGGSGDAGAGFPALSAATITIEPATLPAMTGTTPTGGSGTGLSIVQPTITAQYLIFAGA